MAGTGPGAPAVSRRHSHDAANQKWFADGTEIPTGEGKLHLASVLDIWSRRVVGFAVGAHHDAQLAYQALAMAVAVRGGHIAGVILHTDQGSEGGFNRSSQHLDEEVLGWVVRRDGSRRRLVGHRCRRRDGQGFPHVSSVAGSGY